MNIQSTGLVRVLAKNKREGRDRDGRPAMYYNLAIFVEGEAGNISCTEEAYNNAVPEALNNVVYAYNETYKSFRIIDVTGAQGGPVPEPPMPEPDKPGKK